MTRAHPRACTLLWSAALRTRCCSCRLQHNHCHSRRHGLCAAPVLARTFVSERADSDSRAQVLQPLGERVVLGAIGLCQVRVSLHLHCSDLHGSGSALHKTTYNNWINCMHNLNNESCLLQTRSLDGADDERRSLWRGCWGCNTVVVCKLPRLRLLVEDELSIRLRQLSGERRWLR